jgi:hypothetical protein
VVKCRGDFQRDGHRPRPALHVLTGDDWYQVALSDLPDEGI